MPYFPHFLQIFPTQKKLYLFLAKKRLTNLVLKTIINNVLKRVLDAELSTRMLITRLIIFSFINNAETRIFTGLTLISTLFCSFLLNKIVDNLQLINIPLST